MKTSLIITTYNNPAYLTRAISGALHQTVPPGEIIIADDGSTEDTARLVQACSRDAALPIVHVWHEDRGFRAAKIRNEAIRKCSGEYVILLDGDCVVNRHFISDHLLLAEKGVFVQGKRVLVNRRAVAGFTHREANSGLSILRLILSGSISNIHHLLRFPSCPPTVNRKLENIKSCNMSFFLEDIVAVNGFNERFIGWGNEDSELACRFFKYGLKKKVHPFLAISFHLWHPSNKVHGSGNKPLLDAAIRTDNYIAHDGLVKRS